VIDASGQPTSSIDLFEPASLLMRYKVRESLQGTNLGFALTYRGTRILGSFDTDQEPELLEFRKAGEYEVRVDLPTEILKPGLYFLTLSCGRPNGGRPMQFLEDIVQFEVRESADLSLKSYSTNRPFYVAIRADWQRARIDIPAVR
jgi:hypothetical protein